MGHFYTNITLAGPTQPRLAEVLRRLEWHAYVSPTVGGVTTVFEFASESQQLDVIKDLATDLSDAFDCPALAVVNHDDSVLYFWLYESGKLTAEYHSCPSYFWGDHLPPRADHVDRLCAAFGAPVARRKVEEILAYDKLDPANKGAGRYVWEVERHRDLLAALGLPALSAGVGFCYIRDKDLPEGFDRSALQATWLDARWSKLDKAGRVKRGRDDSRA